MKFKTFAILTAAAAALSTSAFSPQLSGGSSRGGRPKPEATYFKTESRTLLFGNI